MDSRIATDTSKPMAVIFLDIEGVLLNPSDKKINETAHALIEEWQTPFYNYSISLKRAMTHQFSQPALNNLMELIKKISKVAKVGIVISSPWREELPIEGLIDEIFIDTPFVDCIIDKIPDSHFRYLVGQFDGKISPKRELPTDIATKKYGFSLTDDDRGKEIDFWLRENWERFQIDRFVIINNYDQKIVDRYPDHIVQIHPQRLFSEHEADEAYHVLLKSARLPQLEEGISAESEEEIPTRHEGCCVIS